MIRAAASWMRVVLPPGWVLGVCLLVYGFFEFFYFWEMFAFGGPEVDEGLLEGRDALAFACCVLYGLYRVMAFHPLFRPVYRGWLRFTPWTSKKPLPVGPIHLVPQDLLLMLVVVLMLHGSKQAVWMVPISVLAAYLTALAATFLVIGLDVPFYGLAFGLGLGARLGQKPVAVLGLLVLLYPLAYWGIRGSLARFPWSELPGWDAFWSSFNKQTAQRRVQLMGWPFDRLQPKRPEAVAGLVRGPWRALLLSLLAGWHLYAVTCHAEPYDNPAPLLYGWGCFAAVLVRLFVYLFYHRPPISLMGRIFTLRWVVPGYDQALVAPLLAAVLASAVPALLSWADVPTSILFGVSLSVVLFVSLAAPPSLARWHLTGSHRIVPGPAKPQELDQL